MASALRQAIRSYKRRNLYHRVTTATGDQVKVANAHLNWREFWHGLERLQSRPRHIQVGTNWTCNLKCNFCRLTLDSTQQLLKALPREDLEISPRVLQQVLDLMPYPEMMTLTPLGEPMLYTKFGLLLEHHARLGSRNLSMTSNGNLINDNRARMLVEGGMNHIFFSVDSSDPDVYAGMRVHGHLEKVETALDHINHFKEKLGSATPELTLASTFMERNVRQMPDLLKFAEKHRFRAYSIQLMETENMDLAGEFLGNHLEITKEMLLKTLALAQDSPIDVRVSLGFRNLLSAMLSDEEWRAITAVTEGAAGELDERAAYKSNESIRTKSFSQISTKGRKLIEKCHYPWYFLLIDTDGDCRPCCWTGMSFGNLNKVDFDGIWNGEKSTRMRRDFLNNHIPKGCQHKACRVDMDHHGTLEQ